MITEAERWDTALQGPRVKQAGVRCDHGHNRQGDAGGGRPFFLGKELSLVDVVFSPFLERIAASIYYYKGFVVRGEGRWPGIERWFEAMEQRPAYLGTRSDYFTHVHDLPPQLGGTQRCPHAFGSQPKKLDLLEHSAELLQDVYKGHWTTVTCRSMLSKICSVQGANRSLKLTKPQAAVDGEDGKSWHLPLPPLNATSLPEPTFKVSSFVQH